MVTTKDKFSLLKCRGNLSFFCFLGKKIYGTLYNEIEQNKIKKWLILNSVLKYSFQAYIKGEHKMSQKDCNIKTSKYKEQNKKARKLQ